MPVSPLYLLLVACGSFTSVGAEPARSTPTSPGRSTVVELSSPAVGADGTLRESVGLETLGGVFTPLLKRGCEVPCSSTETFSTAVDNQDQLLIHLFRGDSPTVTGAHDLGTFKVVGIPAQSRGTPSVEVTVAVEGQQIVISARDQRTGTAFAIDTAPATKQ